MSTQIQFQAGRLQKFVATRNFSLGNSGTTIQRGAELEFDGTNVVYNGSGPIPIPQLRGAVKARWLVPASAYDPNDISATRPKPAGMQVRSAQGGNPMNPQAKTPITTVDEEEQEVGSVQSHASATRTRNANYQPGQRVDGAPTVEAQDGIVISRKMSPTKYETNFEHESPGEALRRVDQVRIQPGEGHTREELLAVMTDEERAEYLARIDSKKASYVDGEDPEAERERQANIQRLQAQGRIVGQVAPVKSLQKEGFQVNNQVGGGVETFDLGGTGNDGNQVSVIESEGLKFTNTNVGRPKAPAPAVATSNGGTLDQRRRIARAICPDFPENYGFDDSVRKKIARLQADYEDRPDVIRAVAAADTDAEVRQRLLEEFPEAFG